MSPSDAGKVLSSPLRREATQHVHVYVMFCIHFQKGRAAFKDAAPQSGGGAVHIKAQLSMTTSAAVLHNHGVKVLVLQFDKMSKFFCVCLLLDVLSPKTPSEALFDHKAYQFHS